MQHHIMLIHSYSFYAHHVFSAQLSKLTELFRRQQVRFANRRAHLALHCERKRNNGLDQNVLATTSAVGHMTLNLPAKNEYVDNKCF